MMSVRYNPDLRTMADLTVLYGQPHRKYHNLSHINTLQGEACGYFIHEARRRKAEREANGIERMYSDAAFERMDVESRTHMMIWFHDAVYSPHLGIMNEYESGRLWCEYADSKSDSWYEKNCLEVYDGIACSASHTRDQTGLTESQKVFLDCDLAGLGASYEIFSRNGEEILEEYSHLPFETLVRNRIAFMGKMLERKSIYYTDYFRDKYEAQARLNISMNIQKLASYA